MSGRGKGRRGRWLCFIYAQQQRHALHAKARSFLTHQKMTGSLPTHLNRVTSGHNHKNKGDCYDVMISDRNCCPLPRRIMTNTVTLCRGWCCPTIKVKPWTAAASVGGRKQHHMNNSAWDKSQVKLSLSSSFHTELEKRSTLIKL